jgi:TPR repeat protein
MLEALPSPPHGAPSTFASPLENCWGSLAIWKPVHGAEFQTRGLLSTKETMRAAARRLFTPLQRVVPVTAVHPRRWLSLQRDVVVLDRTLVHTMSPQQLRVACEDERDHRACSRLGRLHLFGEGGCDKDADRAWHLCQKAWLHSQHTDGEAAFWLGWMAQRGRAALVDGEYDGALAFAALVSARLCWLRAGCVDAMAGPATTVSRRFQVAKWTGKPRWQ